MTWPPFWCCVGYTHTLHCGSTVCVCEGTRKCVTQEDRKHKRWIWKMTWMDEAWMGVPECKRDMTPHYSGLQVYLWVLEQRAGGRRGSGMPDVLWIQQKPQRRTLKPPLPKKCLFTYSFFFLQDFLMFLHGVQQGSQLLLWLRTPWFCARSNCCESKHITVWFTKCIVTLMRDFDRSNKRSCHLLPKGVWTN